MSASASARAPSPREVEAAAMERAVAAALRTQPDLDAVGCVDLRRGTVLAQATRHARAPGDLEVAAGAALQLCAAPRFDGSADDVPARSAIVISKAAVHTFARCTRRTNLAIIALAHGPASVALAMVAAQAAADAIDRAGEPS